MAAIIQCRYCGGTDYEKRPHGIHGAGAYCRGCGRLIIWLGKHRTPEEQATRQVNKQLYIDEWRAGQDPTQKQLDCLDKLGNKATVGSRLHAHRLIDSILQQDKGR